MRTRRGFRVVLHAKYGLGSVSQPFNRLIIQVNPVDLNFARKGIWIYRESMILRRDFNPATFQFLNRLVGAPMSELELEDLGPKSQSQYLMAKTDAEDRFGSDKIPACLYGVGEVPRIARSV